MSRRRAPRPAARGLPRGAASGPRRRPPLAAVQAAWAAAVGERLAAVADAGLRARPGR